MKLNEKKVKKAFHTMYDPNYVKCIEKEKNNISSTISIS